MSKRIFLPDEELDSLIGDIRQSLSSQRFYGKVDVEFPFKEDGNVATVEFTAIAWAKLQALVSNFSTEVQWHGLVERSNNNSYVIYDILVPPHVVTAATVTSDDDKHREWINALPDDEFNALRFHGHSHVNMACQPSSTDMKYRTDLVTQLPKEDFYIFLIFNKKGEWTGEVYDFGANALYDTKHIDRVVDLETETLDDFIDYAKKQAVETKSVAAKTNDSKKVTTKTSYTAPAVTSKTESKKESNEDNWYTSRWWTEEDYDGWSHYVSGRGDYYGFN